MNELIDHAPEKPHSRVSRALTGTPAFHTDVMSRSRVWAETPPLDTKLEAGVTSAPGPVGTPLPGRAFELQRREGQPGGEGSHTSGAGRLERDTGICQRGLRTETCWLSSRSPPSLSRSPPPPPRAPGRAGRPVQGQNESCSPPCKPPPPLLIPAGPICPELPLPASLCTGSLRTPELVCPAGSPSPAAPGTQRPLSEGLARARGADRGPQRSRGNWKWSRARTGPLDSLDSYLCK